MMFHSINGLFILLVLSSEFCQLDLYAALLHHVFFILLGLFLDTEVAVDFKCFVFAF